MGGLLSTPSPFCKAPGLLVTARPPPSWPCNQGASVAPALGTSAHCCGELTKPCDGDLGASGNTKGRVSLYTGHGPGGGGAVLCTAWGFRDFTGMLCPFYGQGNRDLERVSLPGCPAVSGRNRSAGCTALGHCTASSPDSRRRACNLLCSPWGLLCLRDPGDSLRPEQGGVQAPGWVSSGAGGVSMHPLFLLECHLARHQSLWDAVNQEIILYLLQAVPDPGQAVRSRWVCGEKARVKAQGPEAWDGE